VGNPGPNLANVGYLELARARARDAARNAPLAARAIEVQVTNIIGTGIVPRFDDPDLQSLWTTWEDECDAEGVRDIYALQESAVRSWWESGEVFIRLRPRRPEDGLVAPLQLEVLEADMVPLKSEDRLANGNRMVHGIEFDLIGRRVAYWFHRQHPSDGNVSADISQLTRVPAERVIHLYDPLRPGQLRGFPPLATALQRIQQMSDFDEATIERQKLAASLTLIIRRPAPDTPGIDPITGEAMEGRSVSDIQPGSSYELLPGEEIDSPNLPSLGGEYEAFSRIQGRAISSAVGLPYELLTGDFSGLSDRTARVIINEYRRRVEQHQWHRVVRQMMRPIHAAFVQAAQLVDRVPMDVDSSVRWVPPAWPYFYPTQDVAALKAEIEAGFRSRSDVIFSRGNDPDQVRRERVDELAADRAAGLTPQEQIEREADLHGPAGSPPGRHQRGLSANGAVI